jgi:glucose/arabinose dehydrogenase
MSIQANKLILKPIFIISVLMLGAYGSVQAAVTLIAPDHYPANPGASAIALMESTTVISQVTSSANDAEENLNSGNVDLTSPDLQLGEDNNTPQLVGIRFTTVTIPRSAIIENAYMEFEVDETGSTSTSVTIRAQAIDNAPAFASAKNNISNRPHTTAQVSWNSIPAWPTLNARWQTPNLSAIIQEIVNRPNWASGNSIAILIGGSGQRTAESYDGEPPAAPKLVINYTVATPTPVVTPISTSSATNTVEPPSGSIRFAVIGDYGDASQPELDVANLVKSWTPDFIITTGDNNYPDGTAQTIDQNIGQYYHEFIYPYTGTYGPGAATNRFFPSLGNHDWHSPNARPYLDYFTLPGNERYYEYVWGPVHFFVLDSDSNEPEGISSSSVQATWLQNRLAASTSAWNLVYMHHPPYSSGSQHGSSTTLQWPYAAWGADAVLAGHDHTYERIFQNGITYFVNGLGGRSIYTFGTPISGSQVRYDGDYGAMQVDASESQITFRFINRAGVTIDTYALIKPATPTPTSTFTSTHTPTPTNTPSSTAMLLDPTRILFQEIASGLTQPVFITNAGDGSGRIFIVEQPGVIRIRKNGLLLAIPFLDIQSLVKSTGSEQGLLALAFDPSYAENGNFYVAYTAPRSGDSTGSNLVLEKFSVSANNPDLANPDSGVILLTISHPDYSNHNGGSLAFGQDGYLYWSTGDGGSGGDPDNNAQQLNNLLGKILRIDVHSGSPYGIPTSNPFYASIDPNVKKEIWAYGLRNPWRLSFDSLTHDLYIGDVGQSAREEVDFQPAASVGGENYGWRVMEGSLCYNPSIGCTQSGKVLPVAEYDHTLGCAVTGGYVYRGPNFPSLYGYYFYGDYCSGRLFSLYQDSILGWKSVQLLNTPYSISTFGEDQQGELYLADYATGKLYNIGYQEPQHISGNTGIAGVTLSYTDGTPKTAISLPDGSYSLQVSYNWSGTVSPAHACFTFNPVNHPYTNVITNQTGQNYTPSFVGGSGCADVDVLIAGANQGRFGIPDQGSTRASFAGVNNGPVKIESTNSIPLIGAERVIYTVNGVPTSFSEMIALPDSQLDTAYWLPWYNNVDLDTQLRFGNVSGSTATVNVSIGGVPMTSGCTVNGVPSNSPYTLANGASLRVSCAGINSGPVKIESDVNIVAAERVIYTVNGVPTSFSEMMALPNSQLDTTYWLPWYNNVDLDTQLRFGNVSGSTATVNVSIGGVPMTSGCTVNGVPSNSPYTLANGASLRVSCAGINNGPVKIESNVDIVAAERVIYTVNGVPTSFSEMMALPNGQLNTTYWLPWYNNVDLDTQLRFGNVSGSTATVNVSIGGVPMTSGCTVNGVPSNSPYTLANGASLRVSCSGINNGPVKIESNVNIVAAERVIYKVNGINTSFSEMMALSNSLVDTSFWLPWYNNVDLDTQLRFGVP